MDVTPDIAARRAAGRAVRDLGHALVGHHASTDLLNDVARTLDDLTERIDEGTRRQRDPLSFRDQPGEETDDGVALASYDDRPFSGLASPWGIDVDVHQRGADVEGLVTLRAAHEGAPGRCHGGIVAAWASSGLTTPEPQAQINQELYRLLFSTEISPRLGDAVRAAKAVTTDPDVRRTWIFFGDPTMRLR